MSIWLRTLRPSTVKKVSLDPPKVSGEPQKAHPVYFRTVETFGKWKEKTWLIGFHLLFHLRFPPLFPALVGFFLFVLPSGKIFLLFFIFVSFFQFEILITESFNGIDMQMYVRLWASSQMEREGSTWKGCGGPSETIVPREIWLTGNFLCGWCFLFFVIFLWRIPFRFQYSLTANPEVVGPSRRQHVNGKSQISVNRDFEISDDQRFWVTVILEILETFLVTNF